MKKPSIQVLIWILAAVAAIALASALWNWYHPVKTGPATFTPALPIPQAAAVPKVTIPGPATVKILPKKLLGKALDLPQEISGNEKVEVTATATAQASEAGSSIITTLDTETGETKVYVKENPVPLFGFPSDVTLALRGGITSRGKPEVDVAGRWQFLRVGKARLGVYGEVGAEDPGGVNQRAGGKVMLETEVKF